MMKFDQILHNRKSTRSFHSTPVKEKDVTAIIEAARIAPSACNSQTWRFVTVIHRETIRKICHEAMRPVVPNKWLEQAPMVIAGCSQLDIVANRIGSKITGIEYYQIDLGIAMEHMVLKATELGLGTCWIGWFYERRLKKSWKYPKELRFPHCWPWVIRKMTPAENEKENRLKKSFSLKNGGNLSPHSL